MSDDKDLYKRVVKILEQQLFAVLATNGERGTHSVIVSFVSSANLRNIVFVTPRQTRKFHNLLINRAASLFIDNRSNRISDLQTTIGIEASGEVEEILDEERDQFVKLYSAKYPEMKEFVLAPANAVMGMKVDKYEVVHNFQNVTVLEPH